MQRLGLENWKTTLLLSMIILLFSLGVFPAARVMGKNSGVDLFTVTWDDVHGNHVVSDQIFPLRVYALSLPDVGNYRLSNHSAVVDGVRQAVLIHPDTQLVYPGHPEIKELTFALGGGLDMKLKVNVSLVMVEDWESYKRLVESSNNTIIVNTHDEYLPVPNGYTEDEWTAEIADFMLNRWGTWVHTGGYPFYRVWYQNGTTEEWGEKGFQELMSHIGKEKVTCYPPGNNPENTHDPETFSLEDLILSSWWSTYTGSIGSLAEVAQGFPLKREDFSVEFSAYDYMMSNGSRYSSGAAVCFASNSTSFNFGNYVHMGTWKFYGAGGTEFPSNFATAFTATSTAVYAEYAYAARQFYGNNGDSVSEAIQKAQKEGRTIGLTSAETHFESALGAFASGNYKLSASYASQAKSEAENAKGQDYLLAVLTTVAISVPVGIVLFIKFPSKKPGQEE